jgi:RNA polymerase sigma-70 factor (ECF subfamily)
VHAAIDVTRSAGNFSVYRSKMTMGHANDGAGRRARWMADAQRGDRAAYRSLLDDIGPLVEQFVRRRVGNVEDAKDVYQDILMTVHRARHTYEPSRPFEPWLFAIARRVLTRRRGERITREAREVAVRVLPEIAVEGDGAVRLELERALRRLTPDQRQAFALLKLDGLSIERAAPRAGTTVGALKVRAHRAYRALRRML